jgi:hypothetical protein
VCVNGSALVLCGRDTWFVGGSDICDTLLTCSGSDWCGKFLLMRVICFSVVVACGL